jgi:hypothetical protein
MPDQPATEDLCDHIHFGARAEKNTRKLNRIGFEVASDWLDIASSHVEVCLQSEKVLPVRVRLQHGGCPKGLGRWNAHWFDDLCRRWLRLLFIIHCCTSETYGDEWQRCQGQIESFSQGRNVLRPHMNSSKLSGACPAHEWCTPAKTRS